MKVQEVLNYSYVRSDRKHIFNRKDLDYYISKGYSVVRDYSEEGFLVVAKPTQVFALLLTEKGEVIVECKQAIISNMSGSKISPKKVEDFFAEVRLGMWKLEIDHQDNLIAFPQK